MDSWKIFADGHFSLQQELVTTMYNRIHICINFCTLVLRPVHVYHSSWFLFALVHVFLSCSNSNSQLTNPETNAGTSYLPSLSSPPSLRQGMVVTQDEVKGLDLNSSSIRPPNPEVNAPQHEFSKRRSFTPTPYDGTGMPFMNEQMAPLATFPGRTSNSNVEDMVSRAPLPLHLSGRGQTQSSLDISQSMADYYSRGSSSGLSSTLNDNSRRTQVYASNGRTSSALQAATDAMSAMDLGDD